MAKTTDLHKPGEKAPKKGTYYCYLCSQKGIETTCEMETGQLFLACAKCLERKVAEWDLSWRSVSDRAQSAKRGPVTEQWPGSLGPRS